MPWPAVVGALANAAQVGLSAYGAAKGGGGTAGLSKDDARFVADFEMKQSLRNEQFQNDLAKMGIRMKVADAEAAGLHPLAALGVNTASNSFGGPISVMPETKGPGLGSRLQGLGQDISRAAMTMATPEEKAFKQLQLQKMKTENEILNMELLQKQRAMLSPGTGAGPTIETAGYTIPGQTGPMMSRVKAVPNQLTLSENGIPQQTAGANPIFDLYRTKRGYLPLLSQRAAESTEDDFLAKIGIHLQSLVAGRNGPSMPSKDFRLPQGQRWAYGGPIMGYAPIPRDSATVWEAVHTLPRALYDRYLGPAMYRGDRFYDRDQRYKHD